MGLLDAFKPEYTKYTTVIQYKCRNCGDVRFSEPQIVQILKNKKNDVATLEEIHCQLTRALLYPREGRLGFTICYSSDDSTFYHLYPHACTDGRVGMYELSSFTITAKNGEAITQHKIIK
jgi:NifB/MoaA-like Fe-S oxidoreductase